MLYTGTRNTAREVSLFEAVTAAKTADSGLYMPAQLSQIPKAFFRNFTEMTFGEIAYIVASQMFGADIDPATIKNIVDESFTWQIPLVSVDNGLYSAELFHGPTLTFKDFGARFMARMLSVFHANPSVYPSVLKDGKLHVLLATTGNTGSAVANAFARVPGVELYLLFPRGASPRQLESQFTTLGGNVHALEVRGTIDDCQAMVEQAFMDRELRGLAALTSANSANIARLLPQTFYYFYAVSRLYGMLGPEAQITVGIPAGNMGNVTAALIARRMGLPVHRIVACENANNHLTYALRTGIDAVPRRTVPTLAYAADKSRPTNMDRLLALARGSVHQLSHEVESRSFGDRQIIDAVNNCYSLHGYTLDPHTALSYAAATDYGYSARTPWLMMATGHPAKSLTAMTAMTGRAVELPYQLNQFMGARDYRRRIPPNYEALRLAIIENL